MVLPRRVGPRAAIWRSSRRGGAVAATLELRRREFLTESDDFTAREDVILHRGKQRVVVRTQQM
jgi:hypothetical protein